MAADSRCRTPRALGRATKGTPRRQDAVTAPGPQQRIAEVTLEAPRERYDPVDRFRAFGLGSNERDPDAVAARIDAVRLPCKIAAGQHSDVLFAE
jgi:hypothetical protein